MQLIGKSLLLLFCLISSFSYFPLDTTFIIVFLISVCLGYLSSIPMHYQKIFGQHKYFQALTYGLIFLFLTGSLYKEELLLFFPFILAAVLPWKHKTFLGFFILFHISSMHFQHISWIFHGYALLLLSLFITYLTERIIMLNHLLHLQRDDSKEQTLRLQNQNQQLLAAEDEKIYLATLKERNRIAREIHDNVGHMLTRSILQIGAIEIINKEEAIKEPLQMLHQTLDEAMTNIRQSVHDLHDDSIDLEMSVRNILENTHPFKSTLEYDMHKNVPKPIKYAFIAIIKEAVQNTLKHSNGNQIHIILREHPGMYQLRIQDNGTKSQLQDTGIGLQNMKERIHALNGSIDIRCGNEFLINISILKNIQK